MARKQKLAVALVGLGRIGRLHAENLARHVPEARLAGACEPQQDVARGMAQQFGIETIYASPEALLDDPGVDAVLIASPTHTHAALIEQAAAKDKHIFCEKPIALDLAEIDQALRAVDSSHVVFQVGFNRRFDANFRRIHSGVRSGEIGQVHLLRIISRDPGLPPIEYLKDSGGLYLDMTIHDFDMARYLTGQDIEEVYAAGAVRIDPRVAHEAGDIDTAIVTLKMAGGVLGCIENSRRAVYGYDQRVEVFGSLGALAADHATPDQVTRTDATGQHGPRPYLFFTDRYPQSYITELREFVACALDGGEPPVSGSDGRAAVVAALAAKASLASGRPVRVEEIERR